MSERVLSRSPLLRRIFPFLIPAILTMIACGLVLALHDGAERRAEQAGHERADQAGAVLQGELRRVRGVLSGMRLLFNADPGAAEVNVTRFAPTLLENTSVLALVYAPRVPEAGRAGFERRAGVPIRQVTGQGELAPAGPRPLYFPIRVVVPAAERGLLAGVDAYGVPQTASAIDRAISSGAVQTAPLTDLIGQPAYALVQAVYDGRPLPRPSARQEAASGVVMGGFPISSLQSALEGSLGPEIAYRLLLGGQVVASRGGLGQASSNEFGLAGGEWRVEVARPPADQTPVLVASIGSIGLVLLVSALFAQIARVERERETATRSADQAATERDRTASLVSSLQEGLVILDAQGRVESSNDRFCQMTGSDRAQIVGRGLAEFLAAPSAAQTALLREQVAVGRSGDHDHLLVGADGRPFPALISLAPFRGPDGAVNGTVCTIKDISERKRAEDELRASEEAYRNLAVEQGAFRRVATAIAETPDPESIYGLVAEEAARLLEAEAAWVMRIEQGGAGVRLLGAWGTDLPERVSGLVGRQVAVESGWPVAELVRTGHVARRRSDLLASHPEAYRHSIIAPIRVSGRLWGGLEIARNGSVFPPESDERLSRVAELLATAVSNAESRALLAAQASRDPLTDLANHRSFWEKLRGAAEQAGRYGQPLSLVLFDIDHFKQVNDLHGHQSGDRALAETGRRLRELAREGEVVARTGGEEFAWILPATDAEGAWAAAERARAAIGALELEQIGRITLSAGVCELARAADAAELYALADGALYWAKSHGRDQAVVYDPEVVKALSAEERRHKAEHERVMTGLRSLAAAVDARDPMTLAHSERVAALAEQIAERLGWTPQNLSRLRDAALIHDVGKVGIPDAILLKPGALTESERAQVQEHVVLSTLIAGEVLDAEQLSWVRGHHERWDGSGYPDALRGEAIPEGARIISLADAWDVITVERPYKAASSADEALAECRRSAGSHFEPRLVEALARCIGERRARESAPPSESSADERRRGERRRRPRAEGSDERRGPG